LILHDIVSEAAESRLPAWAVASDARRAHMARVAGLMRDWSEALGLDDDDRVRWRAAGYLHDVLRDEEPAVLWERTPPDLRDLPGPLLHGPAAAERLRVAGVLDGELLSVVAFHTVGDPSFDRFGRALYAADFLEPGRTFLAEWRAALRARVPAELDDVLFEIAGARITSLVERGTAVLPRTIRFWNTLVSERT
jgi:HD superfamily phosphohydrolase YqeK